MSDPQKKLLKALIVGKPNVGKSTLLNSLVGEKISIVSRKAQTTQRNTTGVITKDNSQLIFFDTPGLNKIEKNIRISETFKTVAENVDVLIYMVDNTKRSQSIDDQFRSWLNNNENKFRKKILIINKIDCIEKVNLFEITKKINSVIGFDETFQRLESIATAGSNYPPYNVINGPDGRTSLEIALAGFSGDDIEVSTERNVLNVSAYPKKEKEQNYKHRGIASRSFKRQWQMGADVEVKEVSFQDGLLTVVLEKYIPEAQKKKLWFGKELKKLDSSVS